MDKTTLFWAGLVFLGGFGGAAVGLYLFSPHTSIAVAPLAPLPADSPPTFGPAAPSTPEEEATVKRSNQQHMDNFETGNIPDSQISENADDAPPLENHVFFTTIVDYNGIEKYRPAASTKIACFSERRNKATVHSIARFNDTVFESHVASLNEWVFSGCSDSSHIGHANGTTSELNQIRYLQTRRSLLPATPIYAETRAALTAEIKKHNFFGFLGS